MVCLRKPCDFQFFKGCFLQISLGTFLNTLTHLQCNSSESWFQYDGNNDLIEFGSYEKRENQMKFF